MQPQTLFASWPGITIRVLLPIRRWHLRRRRPAKRRRVKAQQGNTLANSAAMLRSDNNPSISALQDASYPSCRPSRPNANARGGSIIRAVTCLQETSCDSFAKSPGRPAKTPAPLRLYPARKPVSSTRLIILPAAMAGLIFAFSFFQRAVIKKRSDLLA